MMATSNVNINVVIVLVVVAPLVLHLCICICKHPCVCVHDGERKGVSIIMHTYAMQFALFVALLKILISR